MMLYSKKNVHFAKIVMYLNFILNQNVVSLLSNKIIL